jgi:hypothetical protein
MEKKLSKRDVRIARWFRKSKLNQFLFILGQLVIGLSTLLILQWIWPFGETWGYILTFDSIIAILAIPIIWVADCLSIPSLEEMKEEK